MRMRPILGDPDLIEDPALSPVGALGASLGEAAAKAKRAEDIEKRLSEGLSVVELDPASIDPSFVKDRMPSTPEAHAKLVAAIRDNGQQVPILVRVNPDHPGRYQVAYGHRRLLAAADLGRQVRAVVRALSDDELVIAQGQENNERQDLSYIEKARFAHRLEKRFARGVITASMSIYPSDLSNMLSVVSRIPEEVIDAIGPAPGIGRRGWIELADRIAKFGALDRVKVALAEDGFDALTSEHRFKAALCAGGAPPPARSQIETWSDGQGRRLAKVLKNETKVSLTIDRRAAPEFADFVLDRLRNLYKEFEASRSGGP
jgi:ParB family chromosome partitioning protein